MSQLLRVFWDVYHDLSAELPPGDIATQSILDGHREIYEAVAARDTPRAVIAIHDHFRGIRARILT
jgi:DNA-binding FadR family transcriptional regulator